MEVYALSINPLYLRERMDVGIELFFTKEAAEKRIRELVIKAYKLTDKEKVETLVRKLKTDYSIKELEIH